MGTNRSATDNAVNRVTVIVVTYNSAHCIGALGDDLHDLPQIIVVDNASEDDTARRVSEHMSGARWIGLDRNRGFGAANNVGVQAARTDFVLLLNPDCRIDVNAINHMVRAADEYPDASAIGPQLIGRNGLPDISYRWRSDAWAPRGPGASGLTCVGFFSGACMLIRRDAMSRIGGFDEGYFLYYEDDDLCLRLQEHCGPLLLQPQARVVHMSRGSVGGRARLKGEYLRGYHHIQSKFRFQTKHQGRNITLLIRMRYAVVAALEVLVRLVALDAPRAWRCAGRVAGSWSASIR